MRTPPRTLTLTDVLFPQEHILRDLLLILGFSLFLGLLAQISIPLPFTAVPLTGQTFGVLLSGALLGSRRGALTLLAYIVEGSAGLPVFAGGSAYLLWASPRGGYLVGFLAAAFMVGFLAERGWDRSFWGTLVAMLLGNMLIYVFGLPWLGYFIGNNLLNLANLIPGGSLLEKTLIGGLLPFIPGDLLKAVLAAVALPSAWALMPRSGR